MSEPYCSFQVGDKVACVRTFVSPKKFSLPCPESGDVYTVRAVEMRHDKQGALTPGLLLAEIVNPTWASKYGPCEPAYRASAFRPVIDTSSQVALLKKIVADVFLTDGVPA